MKLPFGLNLNREVKIEPKAVAQIPSYKEMIVELSKIDIPTIKENKNRGWVEYGADNLFPERLMEYLDGSALHNAIVINKSKLVGGTDFLIDGTISTEWEKSTTLDQSLIWKSFINNSFGGQNWYDIKRAISLDWIISGSFCLEVIWSLDFTRIAGVNYIPWVNIRPGIKNAASEIDYYYYKNDWSDRREEVLMIPAFDEMSKSDGSEIGEDYPYKHNQLLYVKNSWPGQEYFGRPTYFGALSDIKSSELIAKWNLNSLDNGFTPSVIIKFPNKPQSKEEADMVITSIRDQFSPRKSMQKIAVIFSNGKEQMPEISPISVENIDKQMQELKTQVENSIVAGHMVTNKELIGLPGSGGFAPADLEIAWNIFYNTAIVDEKMVIERVINDLIKINGFQSEVKIFTKNPILR
jgi:hypothetical protein